MDRSNVVFPEPLVPMRPVNSPARTEKLTRSRTVRPAEGDVSSSTTRTSE